MSELKQKMVREMQLRNFSPRTQEAYLHAVTGLVRHYKKHPKDIVHKEIEDYILHMRNNQGMAWNTCNVAISGIKFLYNITLKDTGLTWRLPERKTLKRLPVILSQDEVRRIIYAPSNIKHRAMLMVGYSGGLRSSEVVNLKVGDIDSKRMVIRINLGKGGKDRDTILSSTCLKELRTYYRVCKPTDWLFPSKKPGLPIHQNTLNKVFAAAKTKAGVKKPGSHHLLRHAFATHLLEAGHDLPTIQKLLGHRNIRTTSIYVHVTRKIDTVKSPLDLLDSDEDTPWEDNDDE